MILDAAPTGETLKLLSLPDHMSWYIEKIFPLQRRAAKLVRPFASRARSLPPLPEDSVFAAGQRFYEAIASVEEILTDRENASVRLVLNAEKMVIAEARRAYTYLNLYDYGVDAVVVNRLLPDSVRDPYFARWREAQARHMKTIGESFAPIPILTARLFDREMFGLEALGAPRRRRLRERRAAGRALQGRDARHSRRTATGTTSSSNYRWPRSGAWTSPRRGPSCWSRWAPTGATYFSPTPWRASRRRGRASKTVP